jgi:phosphate transport system permease protein
MQTAPALTQEHARIESLRRDLLQAPTGGTANAALSVVVLASALAILLIVSALAMTMLVQAVPALRAFGPGFVISQTWDPVNDRFGALPFIYGTVLSSAIALVVGGPVAIGTAISLSELIPAQARGVLSALVELLAAIPSVVYGLWGIFVLAPALRTVVEPGLRASFGYLPLFTGPAYGVGMLAGGLILAIMIVPTIAAVSRDVLLAVPRDQREAMLALGATRWEMIWIGVLGYARAGVFGAVILGLGRALGETMAVTMVIGNRPQVAASLFAPGYTLASVIANEFTEATSALHVAALLEIGLVLFAVTIVVNAFARLLVWQITRGGFRPGQAR